MSIQIALLRGINVGGHNRVAMGALRELCEGLGFDGVRTLLQSGNVVFESSRAGAALERLLEKETAVRLGVAADYVVRSMRELETITERNPFKKQAKVDPSHVLVMFLKGEPGAQNIKALEAAIKGPELIHCDGRQLYIAYPAGIGRSKLTGTLVEKKLQVRGTARNWNTVLKLGAMGS